MISFDFKTSSTDRPILSKDMLDDFAENLLTDFNKSLLTSPQSVPIEKMIENYMGLDLDYKDLSDDKSVLGLTAFGKGYITVYNLDEHTEEPLYVEEGTIIIDNHLLEGNLGRLNFTYAHEASHWMLHQRKYRKNSSQLSLFSTQEIEVKCLNRNVENIFGFERNLTSDEDWIEWQADYFASAILLPKSTFRREFERLLEVRGIKQTFISIDRNSTTMADYRLIIESLANLFNVSKKAVQVRLAKLNLTKYPDGQLSLLAD